MAITSLEKPVIAMVRGAAVGAGCNLALVSDLVIASEDAVFGEVFVRVGLASDWGGTYIVPRLVGMARAKELFLTGKMIDAREAERIGLINRVVSAEKLEDTVYELARQLAGSSGLDEKAMLLSQEASFALTKAKAKSRPRHPSHMFMSHRGGY